jgi:hypothetical protein
MKKLFVSLSAHGGNLVLNSYTGDNGCYVCAIPSAKSKADLVNLSKAIGNTKYAETLDKLHTTVMYSEVPPSSLPKFIQPRHEGVCYKVDHMLGHDKEVYIYAAIECHTLTALHEQLKALGAEPSFPDYNCHVTLDKYQEKDWEKVKADVIAKIEEVNEQLKNKRLVVEYESVKVANLKD